MMAEFFDIVIVGGGPAGSTAGTLLAQRGWNVAIFEKENFPRFKIGESLLPGSLCTFERMGVKKKLDQADVIVKYGGKIVSACGSRSNRFLFSDVFRCQYPTAYQVERSMFDKLLLDHAAESGCRVSQAPRSPTSPLTRTESPSRPARVDSARDTSSIVPVATV